MACASLDVAIPQLITGGYDWGYRVWACFALKPVCTLPYGCWLGKCGCFVEVDLVVVGGEVSAPDPAVNGFAVDTGDVCGLGLCDENVLGAQHFAFAIG